MREKIFFSKKSASLLSAILDLSIYVLIYMGLAGLLY